MPVGLLPVIYLAFISLGLPDSAIGSVWPIMAPELGAGISWAGALMMIISCGTILSSLFAARVIERLGTGKVTALSVAVTAIALAGFSFSRSFWQLCLWAIPYGLGAGAVDAALNAYVAVHYESQHMNWLHCMWGVGASAGPAIMTQCLTRGTWAAGFFVLGGIQAAIAVALTLTLPLWKDRRLPSHAGSVGAEPPQPRGARRPRTELLRISGVKAVLTCFFCYSALEMTCGTWAATFCTLACGIDAETSASWASLFYIGITLGRAVSGFISLKVSDKNMIRLGQGVIAAGLALVLIPSEERLVLAAGLVLVGLGCAPIYPSTIHATPARFGEGVALELTGLEMAVAYIGSLFMSPLFGVLAQRVGSQIYPAYLLALLVGMVLAGERLNSAMRARS